PTACKQGVQDCSGTAPACTDGTMNRPPGTSCGTNLVCSPSGACVACMAGTGCGGNANPCKAGVIACGSGAPVCSDGADLMLGAPCSGGFCNGTGTCTACALGAACASNPGAPC